MRQFVTLLLFWTTLSFCPAGTPKPIKSINISLQNFMQKTPHAKIIKGFSSYNFTYPDLPEEATLNHPMFSFVDTLEEIFLIEIQYSTATLNHAFTWVNNYFILEAAAKSFYPQRTPVITALTLSFSGTVVVINHCASCLYGHYVLDILGSIALIEMLGIEYDHICIPYYKNYMKELINLWGIPQHKIIPHENFTKITADKIIVPSNTSRDHRKTIFNNYYHPEILKYVRDKIITALQDLQINYSQFSKKIFISRKTNSSMNRCITNEDEIFEIFQKLGFKRYDLSNPELTEAEKIALFYNATHIVGETGSNMTNILFAQEGTNVLELIQYWADRTFYPISCIFNLHYKCICDFTLDDLIDHFKIKPNQKFNVDLVEKFLYENENYI